MNNKLNILVTGAGGQLGMELQQLTKNSIHQFYFKNSNEVNITKHEDIDKVFNSQSFDLCLNLAAYTAVDAAESEIEIAYKTNFKGVINLAKVCSINHCHLIHISTDYVFDGLEKTPYKESDICNPLSVYGSSKLAGEIFLNAFQSQTSVNFLIIRTSWLYGKYGNNFFKTISKLASVKPSIDVVNDQWGCPTNTYTLAKALLHIIDNKYFKKTRGIFHFSSEGSATWFQFAQQIVKLQKLTCTVKPTSTFNFPRPATRPIYSVFDKTKFKNTFAYEIPSWKDELNYFLNAY